MRKIIKGGYIYIAQPPLYKIQQGKRIEYAYNNQQLEAINATLTNTEAKCATLQRSGRDEP